LHKDKFYFDEDWNLFDVALLGDYKMFSWKQCVVVALVPGTVYPVSWTLIKGPFKIWFNRISDLEHLCSLVSEMNDYYEGIK